MPTISTQPEFRQCQNLDFCYLCGVSFKKGDSKNRDHVPPKAIFAKEDRSPPLILPTHVKCNEDRSDEDEVIGQLLAVLHGKYPRQDQIRLEFDLFQRGAGANPLVGLRDIPFKRIVFRFVRGFHAALYGEPVKDQGGMIYAPLPAHNQIDGELQPFEDDSGRFQFTLMIKEQRKAGRLDRVECFNGKCVYECVWTRLDDGRPFCLFALRIYNWENLGDPSLGPQRGCIGWYLADLPASATSATKLHQPVANLFPLDPFSK